MKRISTAFCILFPFLSLFSSTLNISFTSESGDPAFKYVAVYDLDSLNELASSDVSVTDGFSAEVPDNTDVFVLGIASSGKSNSGF
ncbi:MAG TPA: hypothetical protein PLX56_12090, partial [bacterium]|nr:hypothetical protein [bacterium]